MSPRFLTRTTRPCRELGPGQLTRAGDSSLLGKAGAEDTSMAKPKIGAAMVFSVTPVKVFAHTKGDTFGATTHKF